MDRTDRWGNTEMILEEMQEHWIFETYHYIKENFEEQANMLVENTSFYLTGPDSFLLDENDMIQFDEDGRPVYNRTLISGDFIFEFDVRVPLDPRYNASVQDDEDSSLEIVNSLLYDNHGIVAWYDANKDGNYETAFLFDEDSWYNQRMATGVYYCRSGNQRIETNTLNYIMSGDQYLPLHWLSAATDKSELLEIAKEDSRRDYYEGVSGLFPWNQPTSFSVQYYSDMLSSMAIMGGSAAVSSAVGAGITSTLGGALLGAASFALVMVSYAAYQYWIRPALFDTISEMGLWGMDVDVPEFNPAPDDRTFWQKGWDALKADWTSWGTLGDMLFVDQNVYFTDTNIWWQDTEWNEVDEPLPATQDNQNDGVRSSFKIPLFGISQYELMSVIQWMDDWYYNYRIPEGITEKVPEIDNFDLYEHSGFIEQTYNEIVDYEEMTFFERYLYFLSYGGSSSNTIGFALGEAVKSLLYEDRGTIDIYGKKSRLFHSTLWRGYGDLEAVDYEYTNQMGKIEDDLAGANFYHSVAFGMDSAGRPMLIPIAESNRNLSNPIENELDYLEMCFFTQYWSEFQSFRSTDPGIVATGWALQAVQVIAGVAASNLGSFLGNPSQYLSTYTKIDPTTATDPATSTFLKGKWFLKFGSEVINEIVVEGIISTVATLAGASAGLAEFLGETLADAGQTVESVSKIYRGVKYSLKVSKNELNSMITAITTADVQSSASTVDSTSSNIRINDVDMKHASKAQLIHKLATAVCAQSAHRQIATLMENTKMISKLNYFIKNVIHTNIQLKPFLDNLHGIPIEKFEGTHIDAIKDRHKVEDTIWRWAIAGFLPQKMLGNKLLLTEWGMYDPLENLQTHAMYLAVTYKGKGTSYYYQNGYVLDVPVNGKAEIRQATNMESLAFILSNADEVRLIDPEITPPHINENGGAESKIIDANSFRNNPDGLATLLNFNILHNEQNIPTTNLFAVDGVSASIISLFNDPDIGNAQENMASKIRRLFKKGQKHTAQHIDDYKYIPIGFPGDSEYQFPDPIAIDPEQLTGTHKIYRELGIRIPQHRDPLLGTVVYDMPNDHIEYKMLAHIGIMKLLIPQAPAISAVGPTYYYPKIFLDDQWTIKIGWNLPDPQPTVEQQVTSATINREEKMRWTKDTMLGAIQTMIVVQRFFSGYPKTNIISDLEKYYEYSVTGLFGEFKSATGYKKILWVLDFLQKIDNQFKWGLANNLLEDMFDIDLMVKKNGDRIKFMDDYADDWFRNNWRLILTDDEIKNNFITEVLEVMNDGSGSGTLVLLRKGLTDDSNLYKFITNMKTIQEIFKVMGGVGGFPISVPFLNKYTGQMFQLKYREILDAFASYTMSGDFEVMAQWRLSSIFATGTNEAQFKIYEVVLMESLSKLLINTFFDGDIDQYNNFNYGIAMSDSNIISPRIYPETAHGDFQHLQYISDYTYDQAVKFHIGPRTVDLRTTGIRIDELGNRIPYSIVKDSYSENSIVIHNNAYKNEQKNWVVVNSNNIRSDTAYLGSLQGMGKKSGLPYFERESADWEGKVTKKMAGDFIRFLGQMYGKDAYKSFYIENAGMSTARYLSYKPFDIIGLRESISAPTVCVVPNGHLSRKSVNLLIKEIVNQNEQKHPHGRALGIIFGSDGHLLLASNDKPISYTEYYKKIIKYGNPGDQYGDGVVSGQFSVVMSHSERELFDRARLMAAEQGLVFDGFRDFIEHIRTNENYDSDDFNAKLGLKREDAQMIVAAYGIIWDGQYGGQYDEITWEHGGTWEIQAVSSWWNDLASSTTYYSMGHINTDWSHFAFEVYYGQMAPHYQNHPQLMMLMFSPEDWDIWLAHNHPEFSGDIGIFASNDNQWYDPLYWNPTNPQAAFPEMGYFDAGFIDLIASKLKIYGRRINFLMKSMLYWLYSLDWYYSS